MKSKKALCFPFRKRKSLVSIDINFSNIFIVCAVKATNYNRNEVELDSRLIRGYMSILLLLLHDSKPVGFISILPSKPDRLLCIKARVAPETKWSSAKLNSRQPWGRVYFVCCILCFYWIGLWAKWLMFLPFLFCPLHFLFGLWLSQACDRLR